MAKKWYVVHAYSGYEKKVKTALEERIRLSGKGDLFEEIFVPSEDIVELKKGKKVTSERNCFPGYVLVKMELNDDTWHLVNETPKVTGFLGGSGRPQALADQEIAKIRQQIQNGIDKPKSKIAFSVGERVSVVDGPFATFNGIVEQVEEDKARLKVSVTIFGRSTPVDLEFSQVEKQ
ncbi:MAG: transcription termination/antitermination protein NusG [Magnetococcales bacterium]|nr:transcription termination/antitermination protein NusG [Magnetococcales bacterium]